MKGVLYMKVKSVNISEVIMFYNWLCGRIGEKKGVDRSILYICFPRCRDSILKTFLSEYHAERRYSAFKKYFEKTN